ncbi:surface-adhesin E family protein [Brevundimonas goettingensis]|uniref:Surface-adhesin protein E-like domain-containing protein n=1 Tax=Brevundimonas goettingensis TaxID=2774190 RepID=A0A975C0J6_9CAUL|nr:surface-adhesin E family protein [Brevundimonas goettingensis]QTC90647.1 hypothetical protein IFJ75_15585 [Brevundimonas goettingensis]
MNTFKRRIRAAALIAASVGAAGAASAQTLTNRDTAGWTEVGPVEHVTYFVLPSSIARDGQTVRFLMKADIPSGMGEDAPNTVVAEIVVDCATRTIGRGTTEIYSAARFLATEPHDAALGPASDPGQTLLIEHVCKA